MEIYPLENAVLEGGRGIIIKYNKTNAGQTAIKFIKVYQQCPEAGTTRTKQINNKNLRSN